MTTAISVPRDTEFTWRARRRASRHPMRLRRPRRAAQFQPFSAPGAGRRILAPLLTPAELGRDGAGAARWRWPCGPGARRGRSVRGEARPRHAPPHQRQ